MTTNWDIRRRRLLLTENALVLVTLYLMETKKLGAYTDISKQDVVNEAGRLYGLSNKTVLKAIKTLRDKGLVEVVEGHRFPFRSRVRLTSLGRRIASLLVEVEKFVPSLRRHSELLAKV